MRTMAAPPVARAMAARACSWAVAGIQAARTRARPEAPASRCRSATKRVALSCAHKRRQPMAVREADLLALEQQAAALDVEGEELILYLAQCFGGHAGDPLGDGGALGEQGGQASVSTAAASERG